MARHGAVELRVAAPADQVYGLLTDLRDHRDMRPAMRHTLGRLAEQLAAGLP